MKIELNLKETLLFVEVANQMMEATGTVLGISDYNTIDTSDEENVSKEIMKGLISSNTYKLFKKIFNVKLNRYLGLTLEIEPEFVNDYFEIYTKTFIKLLPHIKGIVDIVNIGAEDGTKLFKKYMIDSEE